MTDRYAGFVVVLDEDVREDDAQATINAIRQIKGVLGVEPVGADINQLRVMSTTSCAKRFDAHQSGGCPIPDVPWRSEQINTLIAHLLAHGPTETVPDPEDAL